MAGGEIKSTLTLDVSKFSSALEKAIGGTENLEKHLKSAAKVAADFDKGITGVGNDLSNIAKSFRLLDQTVESMVTKLTGIVARFDQLGQHSSMAAKGVEQLGSAVKKTTSLNADQWIKKYSNELDKLAPALRNAVSSIIDFDRANIASANIAEKTAEKNVQARLKTLAAERDANNKIIADRERMAAELRAIEEQMQKRADANIAAANKQYFGKNFNHPVGQMWRSEAATAQGAAATAASERAALEAVIKEMKWQNAEIEKRIALEKQAIATIAEKTKTEKDAAAATATAKKAEREAAAAAREAAAESARYARDAAKERMRAAREAADFERQQAREIAQMWKGMGQLWAASKIEQGMKAGIGKASEYQQTDVRVRLLNLPTAEYEEFKKKAFDITKEEKYLSVMDAMQARLDALTAIGYNHKEAIDGTMQSALRNAQVMLSAGYEHGSRSDLIKNLYGFAESRQVMNDPAKIIESFDIARRMGVASGGKINIADMETVARNMGDLRQTMSADGWMGVAALMEQFKVAGSQGHGGAGAGVSSVGTMLKMMSLYAAGKPVTNQAAIQLLGAGVMNDVYAAGSAEQFKNSAVTQEAFRRAVKTAGFKGVKEMSENPVDFFSGLRGNLMAYMKDDKNKAKFFDTEDTESDAAESAALKRFFARMGMSNKTVDGMLTMMNKAFIERSNHVRQLAKDAADEEKSVNEMKETWKNAVDEMNAGAANLAAAFAPALKPLSEIPKAIGAILNKAAQFVKDNPLVGFADLALVAFGGLTLAVKGALNTFGMVGGVMNSVRTMMTAGATATAAATSAWGGLRAAVLAVGLAFPKLTGLMETVITVAARVGSALIAPFATVAGGAAGAIGWIGKLGVSLLGFVARWASPIGWAALAAQFGWVVGEWISSLKLGGITIGDHMQNIFLDIELGWKRMLLKIQEKWIDFKKMIGGDDFLGESAERKEIEAERARLAQYEKDMRITPQEPPKVAPAAKTGDGHGHGEKGGKTGDKPTVRDVGDPFAKAPRQQRFFEDAFARQFYGADTRSNIEQLKLDALISGGANYEEQARQEVIKMWMGGDLDDGKDPSKRKFVKGATYKNGVNTGYNPLTGYTPDQMDWDAKVKIGKDASGKDVEKSLNDLVKEVAERKKLADAIKGVTFATERAAAADQEASLAMERLRGETGGQTDAMRALNREFARQEKANPSIKNSKDYQNDKQVALTKQAIADYANMGANLAQKNKEMEAQFLATERERLEAGVQATYEAKKREAQIVVDQLDAQVKALEDAGKKGSDLWQQAVDARKAGEEEFTRYLKNIAEERARALETPMQKMVREWADVYGQLDKLGEQWANGFMDQLGDLITTGKADWRKFTVGMLTDLSKVMLKKGFADLIGGPQGMGNLGLGGLVKKGLGALGFGMGPAPSKMVNGTPAFAEDAPIVDPGAAAGGAGAEGAGGLSEWFNQMKAKFTEMFDGFGATLDEVGNKLTGSIGGAADSVSESLSGLADSAVPQVTEAMSEQVAQTFALTSAEEAQVAANELVTASEYAEEIANKVSASSEYLANGGVADQFGLSFFANGGAFTNGIYSEPTLFKFANGGQFGVMGEAGPEAVMPLTRDGKGRLGVAVNDGAMGGEVNNITIAITVNNDGTGEKATGNTDSDWRKMADKVKTVVREELLTQRRPGGILNQ